MSLFRMFQVLPVASLILSLSLSGASAEAKARGSSGSGGAVGFQCGERVYLADTYDIVKDIPADKIRFSDSKPVVRVAIGLIERNFPEKIYANPLGGSARVSLGWLVAHAAANLRNKYSKGPLALLNDDNISEVPEGCKKVQIAVQEIGSRVVEEDLNLLTKLTMLERGLYEIHEALIQVRNEPGVDTTPVRQAVDRILRTQSFGPLLAKEIAILERPQPSSFKAVTGNTLARKNCNAAIDLQQSLLPTLLGLVMCNGTSTSANQWTQDQQSAYGTQMSQLLKSQLTCQIMSATNDDLDYPIRIGDRFSLSIESFYQVQNNTAGTYKISLLPHVSSIISSLSIDKYSPRFDFQATWSLAQGNWRMTTFLRSFQPITHELIGDFQVVDERTDYPNKRYSTYGISCGTPELMGH